MRNSSFKLATAVFAAGFVLIGASPSKPSADRGRALYEKICTGCHDLDRLKAAPPLRNVFGRAAGTAQFAYSDALKQSNLGWDEAALDKWLTDPEKLVPGNDMPIRLDSAADRADIIAYLKSLGGK